MSDHISEEDIVRVEDNTFNTASMSKNGNLYCSPEILSLIQKIIAEAVGAFFIIFAGCGSVAVNKMYGSVTFPGICITWGLIVMVMIYTVGHVSGAHFNPAVTVAFTVLRRFSPKEMPFYIIAQLIGATVASAALYLLLSPKPADYFGTVPVGSAMQSFVLEIIISFLLMFVVCGVGTDNRAVGELGGLAVGATILLNVLVAGPISGASMNPARSIGPAIVMHNYQNIWVYIMGPVVGALAGGLTYNLLRSTEESFKQPPKNTSFLRSPSHNADQPERNV